MKKEAGDGVQNTLQKNFAGALPVILAPDDGTGDGLEGWIEAYFRLEVTTSESSQAVQRRDLGRFLTFMRLEEGRCDRVLWTGRLSGAFVQALRRELTTTGRRRYADRTIARITAHLKTFAKWIHKLRPFPLGNPMAKLKTVATGAGLETERALTTAEKRKLLDAADYLPVIGGRSRDRHRHPAELPDERPRRKAYRPWRNRAIVSLLIGTGMRRAAAVNLDLADVDFARKTATVREKGGQTHRYQVSFEAIKAIQDYLREERDADAAVFASSNALFLPAGSRTLSRGRLTPIIVNDVWNEVCRLAGIKGKTPHSARHAMGRHIINKTGNVAAVQRQLGHKNAAYSLQYARITEAELQAVVDAV
jgi:integrase